jgi:hypothetical protein
VKRLVIAAVMSLCGLSLAAAVASADTLVLRDGTRVQGTVVSIAARTITFRDANGTSRRYPTTLVEALEFLSAERVNPRAVNSRRLQAPAGTELVVRTVETIDSRTAGANQVFSGIVEQAVTDESGGVIIPGRSSVQLMIRQMSSGGASGSPEMVLDVQSITIAGRRYLVSTEHMSLKSDTDGGKGAAFGVLVGGAGAQVLTRGRDVQVPAETLLTFRLDKPVSLQADQ